MGKLVKNIIYLILVLLFIVVAVGLTFYFLKTGSNVPGGVNDYIISNLEQIIF